jgi:AraC family ethanolamine operon transcriptional activator
MVGRSERGLRDAFYTVHQMSPKRWVLAQRLQRARRALIEVRSAEVTVTRVAMDNGFHQLGRFAVTYRQAFGETPSETLRGIWPKCTNERPLSCGTERAI